MIDKNKIEKRSNIIESIEDNKVVGYAVIFNSLSDDLGGFFERINSDAIDESTILNSDVFAVLNHDRSHGIFARSKNGQGTLQLTIDDRGLRYEFELADTPIACELKSYLQRGEIDSSSFAFTVESDEWDKIGNNIYNRTIKKVGLLFDISPVFQPAYRDTTVALRALEEIRSLDEKEKTAALLVQRKHELDAYYNKLKNSYKK
jgi:HK97 family phage prohead protease